MTEIEDAPVEAAARTVAPRNKGEDQPAPSTLRGATSALLRKVFRRTSAEIPGDSEGAAAAIPEDCRADPGLVGKGPGEGEQPPGDGRRTGSARTESAVSAGGACADRGGRDSGRAAGTVAEGRGESDADRADAIVNGPAADRAAPESAASAERQDESEEAARRDGPPSDSAAKRGEGTRDGAAAGRPNLGDRLRSLGAPGWTGRDAEWLALVCLHGGVFLRQQYLAFLGRSHPELARRFVQRCGKAAVEERWNASGLKLCRIVDRGLYRDLGVEHLRPRRDATLTVALRRLLSLDYVIDHLDAPWLPTDGEKVAALMAAGVPEHLWPGRVHAGTDGARRRPFFHRLPMALDAERGTFVFVQPEEETQSALRTWGGQHAGLWAALLAAGRAVEVVVVGLNVERLAAAERALDGWVAMPLACDAHCEAAAAQVSEQVRRDEEIATVRTAIATLDEAGLAPYGGLNGAIARCAALETAATAATRVKPMITTGRTWRSVRVPA